MTYVNKLMKSFIVIIIIFCITACSTSSNKDAEAARGEINKAFELNPAWVQYYSKLLPGFSAEKFIPAFEITKKGLNSANILGDFDKNYDTLFSRFIIESPDKSQYIDLDSYRMADIKKEKGKLTCIGFEPDQEVDWVNRNTHKIYRLELNGPDELIEDAKWVDDSNIFLYGFAEGQALIWSVNLKTFQYKYFDMRDTLTAKSEYTTKIRLKNVVLK